MIISTYTNKKNANGGNKLKVVILAGGFGTRISEESHLKPKPMIEIGEKPILWHIMKLYSHYGYNEFVICCGYKQHVIKEWFADYYLHNSDITFDFTEQNQMTIHNNVAEPWKVTLVDTGLHTMTGGRIKRIQQYIGDNPFLLTYGDGVSDINIDELVKYHENQGKLVTLSAYNVGQRFGILNLDESNNITSFREKSSNDGSLVNIGFMVCRPELFDYIKGDDVVLEKYPLETLAAKGELTAYKHEGFWQFMDTQRDKQQLENMCESGKAPWKIWK